MANDFEDSGTHRSIVISAGGTGGHIFPGVALGQALRLLAPQIPVHYLCGSRPLEARLYAGAGITPWVVPSGSLGGNVVARVAGTFRLGLNALKCVSLFRRHSTAVVVGFGGYTTGPSMAAAKLLGIKTVLHEANAIPGKANRWMGPYATLVTGHFSSSLDGIRNGRKSVVGMPLRPHGKMLQRREACEVLGLDPNKHTLLVTGGSQGARTLNLRMYHAVRQMDLLANRDVQILWATGANHHGEIADKFREEPQKFLQVHCVPFIERMDCAMVAATTAIARAGASTVAELLSAGVFPCLVPFPYAVYNHQALNAREVEKAHAGWVVEETQLSDQVMLETVQRLVKKMRELPPGSRKVPPPELDSTHAADRLARLVLEEYGFPMS